MLLDEPTAGLDAPGYAVLEELLDQARSRGATLVLASHLVDDLVDHCERLAVLVDGHVVEAGPPLELATRAGRVALEVQGAPDEALERAEAALREGGGHALARRPARGFLLELYRRLGADRGQG